MSWFKSTKSSPGSISPGPSNQSVAASPITEPEIAELKIIRSETTKPETVKPVKPADVVPRESPKAVFDSVAKSGEKLPREKIGFTVHASKNGETNETQRSSPTITVAKARILFKSGWRVHIADAAGREYGPSEFDEILKFDRH
jgi:hypothetical protein